MGGTVKDEKRGVSRGRGGEPRNIKEVIDCSFPVNPGKPRELLGTARELMLGNIHLSDFLGKGKEDAKKIGDPFEEDWVCFN